MNLTDITNTQPDVNRCTNLSSAIPEFKRNIQNYTTEDQQKYTDNEYLTYWTENCTRSCYCCGLSDHSSGASVWPTTSKSTIDICNFIGLKPSILILTSEK